VHVLFKHSCYHGNCTPPPLSASALLQHSIFKANANNYVLLQHSLKPHSHRIRCHHTTQRNARQRRAGTVPYGDAQRLTSTLVVNLWERWTWRTGYCRTGHWRTAQWWTDFARYQLNNVGLQATEATEACSHLVLVVCIKRVYMFLTLIWNYQLQLYNTYYTVWHALSVVYEMF